MKDCVVIAPTGVPPVGWAAPQLSGGGRARARASRKRKAVNLSERGVIPVLDKCV